MSNENTIRVNLKNAHKMPIMWFRDGRYNSINTLIDKSKFWYYKLKNFLLDHFDF